MTRRDTDETKTSGPVISVRWEVSEINHAVVGARLLLEELSIDNHGDVPLVRDATRAAQAVLELVEARLKLLDRCIGREVDPRLLASRHNMLDEVPGGEEDLDFFVQVAAERR
ncbi:MAG: hypothetical protein V2A73_01285 [Pseudomonadota bacterium]